MFTILTKPISLIGNIDSFSLGIFSDYQIGVYRDTAGTAGIELCGRINRCFNDFKVNIEYHIKSLPGAPDAVGASTCFFYEVCCEDNELEKNLIENREFRNQFMVRFQTLD